MSKSLSETIKKHIGAKGNTQHGLADGANAGFSANDYTSAEKTKLAGIELEIDRKITGRTFLNFKPKIGYFDFDTVANIFGYFDISKNSVAPILVISDNMAVENMYYFAHNGSYNAVAKLRRAYRVSANSAWIYSNDEVRPPYLSESGYINSIYNISNEWQIQRIAGDFSIPNNSVWIVKTYGSSNPADWTLYSDITAAYQNTLIGSTYFPEYNTLFIVFRSGNKVSYKLVDVLSLTEIVPPTVLVENVNDLIDWTHRTSPSGSISGHSSSSMVFNPVDNMLTMTFAFYSAGYNAITNAVMYNYVGFFLPYHVSTPEFFKTGTGTLTFMLTPLTDFRIISDTGAVVSGSMPGLNAPSGWIPYVLLTYDHYRKSIYVVNSGSQSSTYNIRRVKADNRQLRGNHYYNGDYEGIVTYLSPPDATPWAKFIYSKAAMHNGILYMAGKSDKYGERAFVTEYDTTQLSQPGNSIIFKPNTWWLPYRETGDEEGTASSINTAVIRVNATTTRHIYYDRTNLREVTFSDFISEVDGLPKKGKRSYTTLTNPVPTPPSQYTYRGQCYDPIRNRAYFLCYDPDTPGPDDHLIIYWDGVNFIEYRGLELLATYSANSANMFTGHGSVHTASNFLIDTDGAVFFGLRWSTSSSSGGQVIKIDITQPTKFSFYANALVAVNVMYGNQRLSYDNARGYVLNNGGSGNSISMKFSKGFNVGEPEKTRDEFFNNDVYSATMYLQSATGLVSYLQPTPIFLGGYYSMTEAEEILLQPNTDNYIYMERDDTDPQKVNILTSTTLIGGERGFNRVLVSKITTDAYKAVTQEDYPVSWDY